MKAHWLRPRRRFLLRAAYEGRVYIDAAGRYWLDRTSNITGEFAPLLTRGMVRDPQPSSLPFRRILWLSDDALALLGVEPDWPDAMTAAGWQLADTADNR